MRTARVVESSEAGTELRRVVLDLVPDDHTLPGQFVKVAIGGAKPAFFALASSPGEAIALLVKEVGETAQAIADLPVGGEVEVSEVLGNGFGLDRVDGLELVLLVNGSGISAARPVVRAEVAAGLPRPVHLYYGVLTPDRRSFLADLLAWSEAGVNVHVVVGEPDGTGWDGPTGFVQEVAARHGLCRPDVAVVLVGVPQMLDHATSMWLEAGCPPEQILKNY